MANFTEGKTIPVVNNVITDQELLYNSEKVSLLPSFSICYFMRCQTEVLFMFSFSKAMVFTPDLSPSVHRRHINFLSTSIPYVWLKFYLMPKKNITLTAVHS